MTRDILAWTSLKTHTQINPQYIYLISNLLCHLVAEVYTRRRGIYNQALLNVQVRSAGDDAWLCKPAPEDPLLDCVQDSAAAASLSGLIGSLPASKYAPLMTDAMAAVALSTGVLAFMHTVHACE